ncbi:ABC-ATPase domain-containing protein [Bacillus shivajii]|uniref:ABC-ATPase domain-containing protein n=1 Tax=Bacillus shivajii TaxID=1983719 RepID=UPI001CFA3864|nr:ABC-ATPase domain-containing protein [Bacillus shivajii]UCZ54901.1 ABC-ATPase domain-containing protein [Bacillus shivajii]
MKKLEQTLKQLDGKGYKALKSIQGTYQGAFYDMHIDYVQGDPFASPSRLRIFVPIEKTDFQQESFNTKQRNIAFSHFFAKEVNKHIYKTNNRVHGTGKSGLIYIDAPGQEMLERSAVKLTNKGIEFRLSTGLPAQGRKILGQKCVQLLCSMIPKIIENTLASYHKNELQKYLQLADDQEAVRQYIKENDYVTFIANGSILPRQSGINNKPLQGEGVIPFKSPKKYEVAITLPSKRTITGMAIKKGITMIVGGGYHGKSTLLQAIERGVYNHELHDGREFVVTDDSAVKIRSEDGRAINKVDISPFINNLPFGKTTSKFTSENASGSTSQAANIMESIEIGANLLLIDEDTSATNFMIRDARMQQLVSKEKEPITPFIDRVEQLYEEKDISTILVIGGSGDYFDVAHHVIMMDEYQPFDRTEEAKNIEQSYENQRQKEQASSFHDLQLRRFEKENIEKLFDRKEKVTSKSLHSISIGKTTLNLQYVEQLTDPSQTRALANMIKKMVKDKPFQGSMKEVIHTLYNELEKDGVDYLSPYKDQHPGDLAMPRKQELAAALNRIRTK